MFQEGRVKLNDDPCSGRPITVHIIANIELVRAIIEENPHGSFYIYEEETSINRFRLKSYTWSEKISVEIDTPLFD